jgi:hypothetical protein
LKLFSLKLAKAIKDVAAVLGGLILFIFALEALKRGAGGIKPLLEVIHVHGAVNVLGFGWLGAYSVLSGSPVAAISLGLFAGGALNDIETFAMINGSRLGAAFVVLFVGFIYYLKGKGNGRSVAGISVGVVALLVTASIYIPAMGLGIYLLKGGYLDSLHFGVPMIVKSLIAAIYGPILSRLQATLPNFAIFGIGIATLLLSFKVFDLILPEVSAVQSEFKFKKLLYYPPMMFLVGAGITSLTLSVSVSLTLLIPLVVKGYIDRSKIIPYVLGANITTFVDTLFASMLLDAPQAFTIVFVQLCAVTIVSLATLIFWYRPYQRLILSISELATCSKLNLTIFVAVLMLIPALLLIF